MAKTLVEMATDLVEAQINQNEMSGDEVNRALLDVFATLQKMQKMENATAKKAPTVNSAPATAKQSSTRKNTGKQNSKPVTNPMDSIQQDKIICLECGESFKMLSHKHLATHNLTLKQYRIKYGFKARQALCAKDVSERRAKFGREKGLPENLVKTFAKRKKKK